MKDGLCSRRRVRRACFNGRQLLGAGAAMLVALAAGSCASVETASPGTRALLIHAPGTFTMMPPVLYDDKAAIHSSPSITAIDGQGQPYGGFFSPGKALLLDPGPHTMVVGCTHLNGWIEKRTTPFTVEAGRTYQLGSRIVISLERLEELREESELTPTDFLAGLVVGTAVGGVVGLTAPVSIPWGIVHGIQSLPTSSPPGDELFIWVEEAGTRKVVGGARPAEVSTGLPLTAKRAREWNRR